MRLVADSEHVYVIRGNGTLAWNATAYAWRDGAEHWRQPLAGPDADLRVAAGRVFAVHQPCDRQHPPNVERLDPATGAPLWRGDGSPLAVFANGDLLVGQGDRSCRLATTLASLDPENGATRWTVHNRLEGTLAAAAEWFALWRPDGRVQTYDSSGALTAEAALEPISGVVLATGELVVAVTERGLTGYRRQNLTMVWQRSLANSASALGCGPMLCVRTGPDLAVLDPATGRQRWRTTVTTPVYGERVLVDGGEPVRVFDWSTGRRLRELPGRQLVPTAGGTAALISDSGGDIATIDLRSGQVRRLGRLPAPPTRCAIGVDRLACVATGGATTLWRR
jgi:outer membrane protein assembly factor BamB